MNPGVSKRTKSQLFNQFALKHLAMLLGHCDAAGPACADESTERVQELAGRLLDILCTDSQFGICYKPKTGLERYKMSTGEFSLGSKCIWVISLWPLLGIGMCCQFLRPMISN